MNFKRGLPSLILGVVLISSVNFNQLQAQSGDGIAGITAEILNAEDDTIYLDYMEDLYTYSLSVESSIIKNNKVRLVSDVLPGIYRLRISGYWEDTYAFLFLDNDSDLEFFIDIDDEANYTITGNPENSVLDAAIKAQQELSVIIDEHVLAIEYETDSLEIDLIIESATRITEKSVEELKQTIDESSHLDPHVAGLLLNFLDEDEEFSFITTQLSKLVERDPTSTFLKSMAEEYKGSATSAGNMAPEINLKNLDGEYISLSSLQGDYVLIDFWASWCRPCRMESPNLVRAYETYKDNGFKIYSVSIDTDEDRWESAIQQDNLSWPDHVSDLEGWYSEAAQTYEVNGIPASFLVNPEGEIIATDLRGDALEEKLSEIFD